MQKFFVAVVLLAGMISSCPAPENIQNIQVPPENIQIIHLQPLLGIKEPDAG